MEVPKKRLNKLLSHLKPNHDKVNLVETSSSEKRDDDIVIVSACRTAIGKARRGKFKDTHWTDLLSAVMKACAERINLPKNLVEDIQVGTVLAQGGGATQARMAQYLAGYPDTTTIATTNRQCSSGLQAFANIASAIQNGTIEIGMACGVESMSTGDMVSALGPLNEKIYKNDRAKDCLVSMGQTSENVAEKYGITREEQDEFALKSQQKAYKAQKEGLYKEEIIPITTTIIKEDGTKEEVTVTEDEGIRQTTIENLKKLRPAFKKDGSTTAGNSSQVSDGAAAVILMTRRKAKELGLKPLGKFICYSVQGVPPDVMGIGPAFAIPVALKKANLSIDDIDIFEINEAFASQAKYCVKKLGIPEDKVNPLGGAIALGHPLGCTGARQISTLLYNLRRTKGKYGVISMCIGTGMGAAAVFEAE